MKSDLKQTPSLDWMDAPIKSNNWVNLYFFETGHCLQGTKQWPTELEAKYQASICKFVKKHQPIGNCNSIKYADGRVIRSGKLTHIIQLPWKE